MAARRRHRHQHDRSRRPGTRTSGRGCTRASGTACISDNSFAEIRGGQYGYDWTNGVNGTGPRYEDIGNNIINGRNRNWARERRRNQVLGTLSYFKNRRGGDHNFKIGGEIFDETVKDVFIDGFEEDILHVMQNNAKLDVILFQPGESIGGLRTYGAFLHDTWRVSNQLTFNLGVRMDRYRAYSPEQGHPVSRFNPTAQTFAAVDNYISWNLPAPRLGMTYDVSRQRQDGVEGELRHILVESRAPTSSSISARTPRRGGAGIAGTISTTTTAGSRAKKARRPMRAAASATESLDPNLKNSYTKEIATFVEREVMANFGVRAGYVWRGERNQYGRYNINRPYSAFTVPVTVRDPGPDGTRRQRRRRRAIAAFDLPAGYSRPADGESHDQRRQQRLAITTPSRSPAPSA